MPQEVAALLWVESLCLDWDLWVRLQESVERPNPAHHPLAWDWEPLANQEVGAEAAVAAAAVVAVVAAGPIVLVVHGVSLEPAELPISPSSWHLSALEPPLSPH